MSTHEVITICQQLADEGKEPSVALIKPRLTKPVPLPLVISGLKSYKANPKQKSTEQTKPKEPEKTLSVEQRVEQLESEVAELKVIIAKLQASSEL